MDEFEGVVETILPGGDGVIRLGKESVLVGNVTTGDHVRFQVTQKRRGVLRGQLLDIISPSNSRIQPPCPVASECGGCAFQPMSVVEQAKIKTAWVEQAFKSHITSETDIIALKPEQSDFAGRRRVRWFIENDKLGFRKRLSHQIVPTQKCIALTQSLDSLRLQLESHLGSLPPHIKSIQATQLSNGVHLVLESEENKPDEIDLPAISKAQWWWKKLETPSIKPINRPVQALFDTIDLHPHTNSPINIQIGPNDFVQGHQRGNQQLISQILDWTADSSRVVDLFSGCGNLSLPIAAAFGTDITGAEVNVSSVQAANNNAKRLNIKATYETVDLFGKFKIEPFIGADTLIIDPPRKGAKRICNMIGDFFPKQIIMVNCDAAAGSRDAKALQQVGFKLKTLRPLDLFPYTGHVEALSLWTT